MYDPLRFRLLLLTSAEPRTVTELAEAVGRPRGRLYYHVHKLEEHGLLTVAGQHTVGTRVEHSYRARYSSFRLSPRCAGTLSPAPTRRCPAWCTTWWTGSSTRTRRWPPRARCCC
ncbi:ArsR/SmtB family transcription factor [Thermocatellispora tengchongensis]|uniref:ArsR/SmtB family transcription factor n=1 Tax=Thermocatellispora tengchongensis TaxID=1073253 RepID=UPI0036373F9B